MPLRRYVVIWSRRYLDGQEHQIRDEILAKSREAAGKVVTRLYGSWKGFRLRRVKSAHGRRKA